MSRVAGNQVGLLQSRHDTSTDIGLMLVHRLRRCPSIKPTSVQRLIFPRIAMVNIQALVFMMHNIMLT